MVEHLVGDNRHVPPEFQYAESAPVGFHGPEVRVEIGRLRALPTPLQQDLTVIPLDNQREQVRQGCGQIGQGFVDHRRVPGEQCWLQRGADQLVFLVISLVKLLGYFRRLRQVENRSACAGDQQQQTEQHQHQLAGERRILLQVTAGYGIRVGLLHGAVSVVVSNRTSNAISAPARQIATA
ncbi:MAG TPA: hypothetical protein VIX81_05195 [Gammaproteobacteria bacterium]